LWFCDVSRRVTLVGRTAGEKEPRYVLYVLAFGVASFGSL
jgi:hypothetical protein